jgi:serine protease Do
MNQSNIGAGPPAGATEGAPAERGFFDGSAAALLFLVVSSLMLTATVLPVTIEARDWAWLGVRIRDLSEPEMEEISKRHGIREGYGVVIVAILEDSPASRSTIRTGDVVVSFGARPIVDSRTFQRVIGAAPTGKEVVLTVLREGQGRRKVPVQLAPMPSELVGERVAVEFGFYIREATTEELSRTLREAMTSLPVVAGVLPRSGAERAGLQLGDVLRQVNDESLASFRDGVMALSRVPLDQPLSLLVSRGGAEPLPVKLEQPPTP